MSTSIPADPAEKFAEYADGTRLVSTAWVAEHAGDPGLVIVESDEDVLLYETGHIPGAVKVDWHTELNDPVTRDYVDGEGFAALMSAKGISREDTIVVYGDKSNWWAAYALWVFTLFGHEDVRLMDGGRAKWQAEGREMTTEKPKPAPTEYPVVERDDSVIRAFLPGSATASANCRSSTCAARRNTPANAPICPPTRRRGAARRPYPWREVDAVGQGSQRRRHLQVRSRTQELYTEQADGQSDEVIAYCRIGERPATPGSSSSTSRLQNVRNYDGSWTDGATSSACRSSPGRTGRFADADDRDDDTKIDDLPEALANRHGFAETGR